MISSRVKPPSMTEPASDDAPRRQELLRIVRDVLAPLLRADGAEVFLVSVSPSEVSLHLGGRLSGCPGNALVANTILRPALATAAPGVRVTLTSGPICPDGAERVE